MEHWYNNANYENMGVKFKYTFSFAGPVYIDIPATQLLSYYPYLNINSVVAAKGAGLVQPSLHQLPNNALPQIALPVYTPVYNQKPLVSSAKTSYPYPTVVPATFTSKVNLICVSNTGAFSAIITASFYKDQITVIFV